jgi:hypothetical protein
MSGLGISYRPPSENLPIFDATVFFTNATPLTLENGLKYFLAYPNAQGTENLQTTNIAGVLTCGGNSIFNAPLTVNSNITLQAGASPPKSITFSDGTIQTTAGGLVPSGVVAGSYTNTNLTVNTYGIITSATSGASPTNVISTQTFSSTANFAFPVGTQYATIMISGAGGNSGNAYFTGSSVNTGGGGGGGGLVYINRLPVEAGTFMGCSFTSGTASLYYLPIANTVYTGNTTIASASKGGNGVDGTAGGAGGAGIGQGSIVNLTGYGIASAGAPGGAGISTSGSGQVSLGVNLLGYINQLFTAGGYGNGGYTIVNNGAGNDYTIVPAGGAICIVVSYSS